MIISSTLSTLSDTFRNPRERAKAIATWSAVFAVGFAVFPIVHGTSRLEASRFT